MIYIEVKFGAINGNAIDIDDALSKTSTNPVQNKVIAAALEDMQNQIDNVVSDLSNREVEFYETKEGLDEYIADLIETGTDEEKAAAQLKLYYAEDESQLYSFNGTELVIVSSDDMIIFVGTRAELNTYLEDFVTKGTFKLLFTERRAALLVSTSQMFNLVVETATNGRINSIVQTLSNREGYEYRTCTISAGSHLWSLWTIKKYSFEGHTHSEYAGINHVHGVDEITGLTQAILDATINKQDKSDNNLTTTDKTIVGGINEVKGEMSNIIHAFTIDFQDAREVVQMHNLLGGIKLTKIKTDNISTLKLYINGTQNTITLANGEWNGEIAVPADALLSWSIGRTTSGSIASLTAKYQYNS